MKSLLALKHLSVYTALTLIIGLVACTEDHDAPKYTSRPPLFSHVEAMSLDGDSILRAGKEIVITAVQSQKGKLLYKATYKWGQKKGDASHKYTKEVIYDNNPVNPTDTVVFASPGTYTLTMNAKYHISGNYQLINSTDVWADGSVTYTTPTWQYYLVDIEKKITVQ